MVDAIQNPLAGEQAATAEKPRVARRRPGVSFKQTLQQAQAGQQAPTNTRPAPRPVALRPPTPQGGPQAGAQVAAQGAAPNRPRTSPEEAAAALTQAMAREGVPDSWRRGLEFIMHKESRGQIDARNPIHSARGLFQLTRVNYHLNPSGEASFGNGVEEAQGGIRYIKQRYGSAEKAVEHWHRRGWY
jgi:hypothetical protein